MTVPPGMTASATRSRAEVVEQPLAGADERRAGLLTDVALVDDQHEKATAGRAFVRAETAR